jgi:exodeoxyribonuclease-5
MTGAAAKQQFDGGPCRWSPEQDQALGLVRDWLSNRNRPQVFRLFGYAGTGKTELTREIGGNLPSTRFAAFTGKAAHVMRMRGCEPCSTIHKLIYQAHFDKARDRWVHTRKPRDALANVKLIVVDEASMINERLATDLLSFGIPLLTLCDPAQLPPVNGQGYFITAPPDVMLTEIHRQARDNPILQLADVIRRGGRLPHLGYRADGLRIAAEAEAVAFDTVLVGRNTTRHDLNRQLRIENGFATRFNAWKTNVQAGETVVCLRNDYAVNEPVFNGSTWTVTTVEYDLSKDRKELPTARMTIRDPCDGTSRVRVPLDCFGSNERPRRHDLQWFDFGYCLTVHKAQGSEWNEVLVINEAEVFGENARQWLYTAITRAKNRLTIINPD